MYIYSKPPLDQFHLKIYDKVTPYLFKPKDPIFYQKVEKLNKKIVKYNLKTKKSKSDYLILLITIIKTIALYKQIKDDKDRASINLLVEN